MQFVYLLATSDQIDKLNKQFLPFRRIYIQITQDYPFNLMRNLSHPEPSFFRRSRIRSLLTYFCYGRCCLAILKMKIFSNFLIGE